MRNLTIEQKKQFNEIFEKLGNNLDITETQFNIAVHSYNAVGEWLSKDDSILAPYSPKILPQGSFMLGTMIKPINKNDDLDIDLVCQLKGKDIGWTQKDVKNNVGQQLKNNQTYKDLLDEEGRRCWTLLYREKSNNIKAQYHMDILPCIVDEKYQLTLKNYFSISEYSDVSSLAIRITDKKDEPCYSTVTDLSYWKKSNPFGYAKWFFSKTLINATEKSKLFALRDSIEPVPKYSNRKSPLQRIIQILKRHRDIMFLGNKDKPISIIITTLAAKAYKGEINIIEGLSNVIDGMLFQITEKNGVKWVENPVNPEENFADKWAEKPQKQTNFYNWISQVKKDVDIIINGINMIEIQRAFEKPFGKNISTEVFCSYADKIKKCRESNKLKMETTGILGSLGKTVRANHNFYGK